MSEKPEPQENPVTRRLIQKHFIDGKWWTSVGIAVALGSKIPDDLAVRYYRYKQPGAGANLPLAGYLAKARRKCVQDALSGLTGKLVETKVEQGEKFYKLLSPVRQVLKRKSDSAVAQTAPGGTETGLSTGGVYAALVELGGTATQDQLIEKLLPCMVPSDELLQWYRKQVKATGRRDPFAFKSKEELIRDARRSAVVHAMHWVRQTRDIRIDWEATFTIMLETIEADEK